MYKNLVIVESPTKAKTVSKMLGSDYKVVASVGHIRDLPKSKMGIDIDNNFEPEYINVRGKASKIKELKELYKNSKNVYLATDPDREGEAISWHIAYAVETGTRTLKDAVDAAFGAWMNDLEAFYVLGSAVGPHPYPTIVHEFQKVISEESRRQILEKEGRLPDYVIACVGGGSNAIGAFSQYVADEEVKLVGVEAAGHGLDTDKHAATMTKGSVGIVDGMKTYAVFKEDGELAPVYSISAGLDYPGVGPEHAFFKDSGRVEYVAATDEEAVQALLLLSKAEGIIPAIESSHAIAEAVKRAPKLSKDEIIIINVSGRGDKDVAAIADYLEAKK